ncbi:radical SAM protein [Candidatus Saganbacteria bacterium]|nr:radical SAM protein [Candidatus Saganbacteria bacterium]
MLKTCIYYLTYRSNDTCEFDDIWSNEAYQKIEEAPIPKHLENIRDAGRSGAKLLEVTGGEPLLYSELPQILTQAKKLGFITSLTTNGILYSERAKEIRGLIDNLSFFLDYPMRDDHNRSRGIDCFNLVLSGIELARQLGENPAIKFNVTRDSVRYLPEMADLAQYVKAKLFVHPLDNFGGQWARFEARTLDHISYFFKRKDVVMDLAEVEFLKNRGNNTVFPRCRASETTITYLPDGTSASPCFENRGGRQGRENICSGCTLTNYMLPSFEIGLDKYRMLHYYSNWYNGRKSARGGQGEKV